MSGVADWVVVPVTFDVGGVVVEVATDLVVGFVEETVVTGLDGVTADDTEAGTADLGDGVESTGTAAGLSE